MSSILNIVKYTTWVDALQTNIDRNMDIPRPYRLTIAGAQRLVRQVVPEANVYAIETFIDER